MAAANLQLTPFDTSKTHSEKERWICLYPAYINSKKTRQEGRKIAKGNCVENPTYLEVKDVLSATNLNIMMENKLYPRERSKEALHRGRIRIQIKNDDGTLVNPEFPTRDHVFTYVGKMIPQLKSRQNRPSGEQVASSSASTQSTQKKGKGKRR